MTALVPPPAPAISPATTSDGTQAAPKAPTVRDPFFDNVKFLAILLVVAGHAIENVRDVRVAHALYLFVYLFHMPLFIVVTGYFSRNFTFGGGKARKLITNLGVPYVVFETAYSLFDWLVGKDHFRISLLDPYYLTWFLMALFLWRLSTPVWQQIRWPLGVAVAISLLSFMAKLSGQLDMHRVFGLAPFYVLGLMLRPEHFDLLRKPAVRVLGAVVLAVGLATAYLVGGHMSIEWVYWRSSHDTLGVDNVTGTLMRMAMLICSTVLLTAFLAVVPRRRTWFTAMGATTLYAYLLHGFVPKLMIFMGWYGADWLHTIPGTVALVAGALVLGTLLCTPPVQRTMRWALEPRMPWAFTPLRRPGARAQR